MDEPDDPAVTPARRVPRNDFAPASLAVAVAALVSNLIAAPVCIGLGAAAVVLASFGIRAAVRLDRGMAMSLFGLGFGLFAAVVGTVKLGFQHGAQYAGLAPSVLTYLGR